MHPSLHIWTICSELARSVNLVEDKIIIILEQSCDYKTDFPLLKYPTCYLILFRNFCAPSDTTQSISQAMSVSEGQEHNHYFLSKIVTNL